MIFSAKKFVPIKLIAARRIVRFDHRHVASVVYGVAFVSASIHRWSSVGEKSTRRPILTGFNAPTGSVSVSNIRTDTLRAFAASSRDSNSRSVSAFSGRRRAAGNIA